MTSSDWLEIVDRGMGIKVRYPARTAHGAVVTAVQGTVDRHRLHLSSADQAVYVEIVRLSGVSPSEEYRRHRGYLEQRFGPDAVTGLQAGSWSGFDCASYEFDAGGRRRHVTSIAVGGDMVRIVFDPSVQLNHDIVASIVLDEAGVR